MSVDLDEMVTDILDKQKERQQKAAEKGEVVQDYPALHTLSRVYRIFAWVMGIIAAIGIVLCLAVILFRGEILAGFIAILIIAFVAASTILFALAVSELLKLFIRIELNTRKQ
jgi:hypothetical protein